MNATVQEVYFSPAELHYFKSGDTCVGFVEPPNIAVPESTLFRKVLVYKEEITEQLFPNRIVVRKKY